MGNRLTGPTPGQEGGAGAPQPPWRPPTAVEQRLHDAGDRADWPSYFRTLASTQLYLPAHREQRDAAPDTFSFSPFRDSAVNGLCQAVFTRGMLPPPDSRTVHETTDLALLARRWPRSLDWLAVNPGTPVETFLPAGPRTWRKHARSAPEEARLKTLWTGHLTDTTAHGMACGALLLVNNGQLWNHLGWQGQGYSGERGTLREWWNITGRDQLVGTLQSLVRGRLSPPEWEFPLRVRQALHQEYEAWPDAGTWRQVTERLLLARTAELVDSTGRPPEFDLDADLAAAQEVIGRILRYEARFRADGLLADDAVVRSVLAWDFGRASAMARWGVGARYCEVDESHRALRAASSAARQVYRSWPDFAAGYVLGRCLHFDDENFGPWYGEMLEVHRILNTETDSPWLTVPWQQPPEAGPG